MKVKKQGNIQKEKKKKKKERYIWVIKLTLLAFAISISFSFLSEIALKDANLFISTMIVFVVILIGILFDMIGVSVTAASEAPFHSMSSRRIKAAKVAVQLKKNADKVSSFCNDVIGDICGILSGSAGVVIASSLAEKGFASLLTCSLVTTAIIAAFTIGGKALGKTFAMEKSNEILLEFSKVLSVFYIGK